jgi:hypothetical protein
VLGLVKRLLAVAMFVPAGACAMLGQPTDEEPLLSFVAMVDLGRRDLLGGVSGLEVDGDGITATAVRDDGLALQFPLAFDADGKLVDVGAVRAAPLGGVDLEAPKGTRDAEALRRLPDGSWLVAYEGDHRVVRHAADWAGLLAPPIRLDLPADIATLPPNKGLESVAVAGDGTIAILAEASGDDGLHRTWLRRDGKWIGRSYRTDPAYQPTDAVFLPNGDLLVLERAFSLLLGVRCRLTRVPAADVAKAEAWEGRVLGAIRPPAPEAEDNFSDLQRTLLLQFTLTYQAAGPNKGR